MTDIFTPEKRSEVMSRIRGRNTKPELALRSMLHRLGYRFTVNGPEKQIPPRQTGPRAAKIPDGHLRPRLLLARA